MRLNPSAVFVLAAAAGCASAFAPHPFSSDAVAVSRVVPRAATTTTTTTTTTTNAAAVAFRPRRRRRSLLRVASSDTATTATTTTATSTAADDAGGCTIGDTRGASLLLTSVSVSRGPNQILRDVEWRVEPNQRWGIVGPNGAGKSTLLGAITGSVRMDGGKALICPGSRVGYLRQTAVSGSVRTAREEAGSEMREINSAKRDMEEAERKIEGGDTSDAALSALDDATQRFADAGGWTQDQEIETVLRGLGFTPADGDRPCTDFSGGWQMRIALARLLLSKPTVLLLDEPSNHLDSSARDWLAKYLAAYDGSLILVSHDAALLERSVDSVAEISAGTLLKYPGCSLSKYEEEREFRAKSAKAEYERNLAEAAKLQAYVDRFGASATKASSAQSRVKALERMRKEGKLDAPAEAVVAKRRKPVLNLPDPPKSMGEELISLKGASVGHDPDGPPLLKNVDLTVMRGMKLILRGPNGAGKSTLLSAMRGALPLLEGKVIENEKLRLGSFTQDLAQELDPNSRALDLATEYARGGKHGDINVSNEVARGVMGALGLSDDKPLRLTKDLSSGEKARVALSMFALKASNLLILDEPSNHLDVECVEALGEALGRWGEDDGGVVVVSHDRQFCDMVGFTHVGTVKDGTITIEERGLNSGDWSRYDLGSKTAAAADSANDESGGAATATVELTPEEKEIFRKRQKLAYNAPKRIEKLEALIEQAEAKVAEYDEEMMTVGNDVGKLTDITKLKEKEEAKIAEMMEEWEDLEEVLAEFG